MVDAPDPTILGLSVTISRVEAHVGSGWMAITTTPQTFQLFDLITNEAILGSLNLPTGHYTQIRLFPTAATVTDTTGTYPVTIPSGAQTGIKLNVDYDITANVITTILLDFNVSKSLVRRGNGDYLLQPVIPAVVKILSGTVTGTVTVGGTPVAGAKVEAVPTGGTTGGNSTFTTSGGSFKLWALPAGTYDLEVTYTDAASVVHTKTVSGVTVVANQDTAVGTIAVP